MVKKRKKVKHYRASKRIVGYEDMLTMSSVQLVAGSIGGAILLNLTRLPDYIKYVLFFISIFAILIGITWAIYSILLKERTMKKNLKRAIAISGLGFILAVFTSEMAKYFVPGYSQSVMDFSISQPATVVGQVHPLLITIFMSIFFSVVALYLYITEKR